MEDIFKEQGAQIHSINRHFLLSSNIFSPKIMGVSEGPYVRLYSRVNAVAGVPVILPVA
jgi:hypothetical protein